MSTEEVLVADEPSHTVTDAVRDRRSVRAFTDEPVPAADLERILTPASRAASNSNTQPWHLHVLTGAAKDRLVEALEAAFDADEDAEPEHAYQPAPDEWPEPLRGRRQAFGKAMLGDVLGIARDDAAGRRAQRRRNFAFYGAPVGMILTVDRGARGGGLVDAGIYLQTIMLLARERGLDTCAQVALQEFHPILRERLAIPDDHVTVCGLALGHADRTAPIDALRTDREPVAESVTFHR